MARWPHQTPALGPFTPQAPQLLNYSNYVMRFGPSLPQRYERISSPFHHRRLPDPHDAQPPLHRPAPGWRPMSPGAAERSLCHSCAQEEEEDRRGAEGRSRAGQVGHHVAQHIHAGALLTEVQDKQ